MQQHYGLLLKKVGVPPCFNLFPPRAGADALRGYACLAIAKGHFTLALTRGTVVGLGFAVPTKTATRKGFDDEQTAAYG